MDISKGTRTALGLVGAVMLILTVVAVSIAKSDGMRAEAQLPLIAIMGVATMLAVLTLMALAFSSYNLADRGQALGLPEGSVRAVIALSLIIIFAVVSIFLFSSLRDIDREQECRLRRRKRQRRLRQRRHRQRRHQRERRRPQRIRQEARSRT
jgi:hypothetical protein